MLASAAARQTPLAIRHVRPLPRATGAAEAHPGSDWPAQEPARRHAQEGAGDPESRQQATQGKWRERGTVGGARWKPRGPRHRAVTHGKLQRCILACCPCCTCCTLSPALAADSNQSSVRLLHAVPPAQALPAMQLPLAELVTMYTSDPAPGGWRGPGRMWWGRRGDGEGSLGMYQARGREAPPPLQSAFAQHVAGW